jgi:hypothetical protein
MAAKLTKPKKPNGADSACFEAEIAATPRRVAVSVIRRSATDQLVRRVVTTPSGGPQVARKVPTGSSRFRDVLAAAVAVNRLAASRPQQSWFLTADLARAASCTACSRHLAMALHLAGWRHTGLRWNLGQRLRGWFRPPPLAHPQPPHIATNTEPPARTVGSLRSSTP